MTWKCCHSYVAALDLLPGSHDQSVRGVQRYTAYQVRSLLERRDLRSLMFHYWNAGQFLPLQAWRHILLLPSQRHTPMPLNESSAARRYKVMIVDDHPMFREYLGQLINRDLGMSVCGEADNTRDAMRLIRETRPDVVILDITLRGLSGLELLKELKAEGLELNVLVLSMHDEELYSERALRAGACGYITKNEASSEVIKAIRKVMAGEVYVSKLMTSKLLHRMTTLKKGEPNLGGVLTLADRELEVFQMLGRGKSTSEIAQLLHLAQSTVETYRARIKEKLGLSSAADIYLRAGHWVRENGG